MTTGDAVDVSVALLVRDGMPGLATLLAALGVQVGCGSFEVVAVDSGSTDGSLEALAAAGARVDRIDPATFRFGPARQRAFELTRGRVIVTLSQDAVPGGPGWLAAMTAPILSGAADLVQSDETPPADARALAPVHHVGTAYAHWPMPWVAASCSGLAISRAAWARTGFGDAPMSEDKYLAAAARRAGFRMSFNRDVPLLHGHRYTARSLFKRGFNEGMGAGFSEGRYSLRQMIGDLTNRGLLRFVAGELLWRRRLSPGDVLLFPLRPIGLYLGHRFGKRYWR